MAVTFRNLAVVIGINTYRPENGIKPLGTAVNDARAIAQLLKDEYKYSQIWELYDEQATYEAIKTLLNETLPKEVRKSDRLLFYFAGHGITRKGKDGSPAGYLIPQNAKVNLQNAENDQSENFLPMQELYDAFKTINCHHLLVILDCCYAGMFRWATRKLGSAYERIHQEHYARFIRYPAWQVIASAAHDQEALDLVTDERGAVPGTNHSPFALALLEGLGHTDEKLNADLTGDGVITTPELYFYVDKEVNRSTGERQTPGFWSLRHEFDRGEFIFVKPGFDPKKNLTPAPPLNASNNPYRGLESFEERHARFFFGRTALVEELSDRLSKPGRSLTIVLGVSGSGKSSLVKAGLIPYLRNKQEKDPQAQKWYILDPMRPSESPFTALARVILPLEDANLLSQLNQIKGIDEVFKPKIELKQNSDLSQEAQQNQSNSEKTDAAFPKLADSWNNSTPEAKLLLIVDYFNQLQEICPSEELTNLENTIQKRVARLASDLQKDPRYLTQVIASWSQINPNIKLLLIIDQFEELITMAQEHQGKSDSDQKEWQQFLSMLTITLASHRHRLHIVATLRSDFEPRFLDSPLKAHWRKGRFPVRAMNSDELREAIEQPARKQALYFEPPDLVGRLIDEVGQMPGALPLLSFTLSELYIKLIKRWIDPNSSDRALRIEDYNELGGVAGALTRRATEEYDNLVREFGEALGKAHQATMQRVMLRMVAIEGGGVARRRVPESELVYPDSEENKRVTQVGVRLVKARLLVKGQETGEPYVEPAHDFLVRGWDKLQEWIKQSQGDLALQQRLTPAANDWSTGKGGLWTREVDRLAWLEKVLESPNNNWLNKLETEFVKQSKKQRLDELKEAEERRKLAVSRQLAAQAELARNQLVKLLPRSLLLAIESIRLSPSLEADNTLRSGLSLLPRRITQISHQVDAVAFSPNGQYLAMVTIESGKTTDISQHEQYLPVVTIESGEIESGKTTQVQVYKVNTGEQVTTLNKYTNISGVVTKQAIAFSPPDEKYLVTVTVSSNSDDISRLQVWEVATGNEVTNIPNLDVAYHPYISQSNLFAKTAFSPDGKFIATVCLDENTQLVRVWEIATAREEVSILQKDRIDALAFSSNGKDLYLAGTNSENPAQIRIWEAKTSKDVIRITGGTSYNESFGILGFSPDGKYIAASAGSILQVWDVSTTREVARLSEFNEMRVRAVAFSPDGKYLTTLSGNTKNFEALTNPYIVQVWEVNSGKEIARVPHHSFCERNLACSSHGRYLATGNTEGIQVWEITRGNDNAPMASIPCSNSSSIIALSPDGKYLATTNYNEAKAEAEGIAPVDTEEIQIWETATGNQVASIPQEILGLNPGTIALSLDAKYIAAANREENTQLKVWEVATKKQLESIHQKGEVKAIVFSPNGKYLNLTVVCTDYAEGLGNFFRVSESANSKELVNIPNNTFDDPLFQKFALNLDGKYLAISGKDVTTERSRSLDLVRVLEVSTGQEVGRISFENFYRIDSIALSSDGQYLAMIGVEDTDERPMYIWEVKTGRPRVRITSDWHFGDRHFGNVALSQRYLALQVSDTVHIFLWRPEDLTNEACARLNRNLTQQEWRQFFPDEPYRKTCPNLP
ncbi:caspase family protein [Planktothrix sp. FACHB-1355]|uniref:Caspase family protein n=1 Tax=Aerosakkonema funiforme FACHB-1375 TaxID=2949571 RepID=A0A926ZHL5_9CYAN|nr:MULTISPECIES: caspase family protein [Oscillatoriales]MBD2183413.1 caspase family protein [Aerosakkonema funiforme FACHB-1375]MBD3557650.1 caspase family protein [Planktothrix sp. FACHB-1355]